MEYRRLGRTGIKVSVLSFGSWVTFDTQVAVDAAVECMQAAHDAGCNFFDNAEAYAGGRSEEIMGEALRQLGWPRWSYVVTTKLFWGIHDAVNMKNTLNRKYLMQAIDGSLERFGLDFVDVVYCHRADPDTPIEETVWAMSDIVSARQGAVLGNERVGGDGDPRGDRGRRTAPPAQAGDGAAAVQPARSASGSRRSTPSCSTSSATAPRPGARWRPGCSPASTATAFPTDSRGALPGYGWLAKEITDPAAVAKVEKLRPIADELGCTLAQLALAWCTKNPNVSTVITGASKASQVVENFAALDVIPALTPEVLERIDAAVQ